MLNDKYKNADVMDVKMNSESKMIVEDLVETYGPESVLRALEIIDKIKNKKV